MKELQSFGIIPGAFLFIKKFRLVMLYFTFLLPKFSGQALMQKSNKKNQGKKNAPPFFRANAQRLRKIEICWQIAK
jgi:hypothetical protein